MCVIVKILFAKKVVVDSGIVEEDPKNLDGLGHCATCLEPLTGSWELRSMLIHFILLKRGSMGDGQLGFALSNGLCVPSNNQP